MTGYPFPDPIDPHELVCFKVYVPKHAMYLGAFWRSFQYLTTWHAWGRDEAHTGKDVAAVWQAAYDLSRLAYVEGEGCGEVDGVEFRVVDCQLQFKDPCDGEWKPVAVGGATENYDPLHDDPILVPYPDEDPDPETGTACLAAANAALGIKEIIDRLDYAYATGSILAWIEVTIVLWSLKLVKWITQLVANANGFVTSYTYEQFHEDYLAFDWDELKELLHCYYDENGVMTEPQWNALLEKLAILAPTSLVWLFIQLTVQGVGSVGMTNGAGIPYVTSAECDSCGCPDDTLVFERDASSWPSWTVDHGVNTSLKTGTFESGEGFSYTDWSFASINRNRLLIAQRDFTSATTITKVQVRFRGEAKDTAGCGFGMKIEVGGVVVAEADFENEAFDKILTWNGSLAGAIVRVYTTIDCNTAGAALEGWGFINDITICGTDLPEA